MIFYQRYLPALLIVIIAYDENDVASCWRWGIFWYMEDVSTRFAIRPTIVSNNVGYNRTGSI